MWVIFVQKNGRTRNDVLVNELSDKMNANTRYIIFLQYHFKTLSISVVKHWAGLLIFIMHKRNNIKMCTSHKFTTRLHIILKPNTICVRYWTTKIIICNCKVSENWILYLINFKWNQFFNHIPKTFFDFSNRWKLFKYLIGFIEMKVL